MNRASLNTFLSGMMMLFLVFSAPAQNTSSSFSQSLSFSAALHYGFSNPANIKLESIQNSRSFLEELDISSQTTGQKIWQQQAGYPIIGLSFLFGQYIEKIFSNWAGVSASVPVGFRNHSIRKAIIKTWSLAVT